LHFSFAHDLVAKLDAVERAFLSPELGATLALVLAPGISSIETVRHELAGGELHRVLRFQPREPPAIFRRWKVEQRMLTWETHVTHRLADHASTWEALPHAEYRAYFRAGGTYRFEAAPGGRTRRIVSGDMAIIIPVPLMGPLVERFALVEVRKTYDAEAEALRRLLVR
jgi:hypothetical protein